MDTPCESELIAANNSIEEIRKFVEADSLAYLSLGSLRQAVSDTKGEVPVKKYKTNKKMVQSGNSHLIYASFALQEDMGTVEIGYSYVDDDGNEEIYWFPAEEILDPDSGAVEYVPLSS